MSRGRCTYAPAGEIPENFEPNSFWTQMAALKKIRLKKHKVNSATSNDRLTEIKFEWLFSSVLFKNHCYNHRECRKIVDSSCRGFWNSQISLIGLRNLLILQLQILLQRIYLCLCTDSHTRCFAQIHWDRTADWCPLVLRLESIFCKCNVCQERSFFLRLNSDWNHWNIAKFLGNTFFTAHNGCTLSPTVYFCGNIIDRATLRRLFWL